MSRHARGRWPSRWPLPAALLSLGIWGRFVAALAAVPVVAAILGLIHGNWYGYWG